MDEIGEASLKFQLTLLRVFENCVITKLGGLKEESLNVRVLCAANKPVEKLAAEMRTDLFHRISTFPLYIQPLMERKEDIPKLASYFIRQFRKEYNEQAECLPKAGPGAGILAGVSNLQFGSVAPNRKRKNQQIGNCFRNVFPECKKPLRSIFALRIWPSIICR